MTAKIKYQHNLSTRKARHADMDVLVRLLTELFSIEADFTVDTNRQRRGLKLMLENDGDIRRVNVAEIDGRVVGMCTAQILVSTAEGNITALIEDMVVANGYRKMGVGSILLKSIEEWALDKGVSRLQLLADRMNFNALDFYDKNGWLPTQLICLRKKRFLNERMSA